MDVVSTGGMPQMVFEYILKQNGLDPSTDLEINQNIDFGSTAAAFSGGQGDYTVELHNLILQKTISELRTTCNVYLFINCLLRMSEAYSDRTSPHYSFFAITFLKMSIKNTTHF